MNNPPHPFSLFPLSISSSLPLSVSSSLSPSPSKFSLPLLVLTLHTLIWVQTKKTFLPEPLNKGQDWNRPSQWGDPEEECDAQDAADFEDMSIRDLNDDKIEVFP